MALKVQAKDTALAAGVPLAPGTALPAELDAGELTAVCERVGYPLLIKASAGGGGKGMRVVHEPSQLPEAIEAARHEAASAFGDATVFAERFLAGARHVEVQVFGDMHGHVVHCFERECSIQRRHQKVIEETPSPGITPRVRRQLLDSAVALARAIDYVGAGTVEFLVFGSGEGQQYCFLEMNTRLQVEHPVTEAVTGIDLVAWQILVAQGETLPVSQEQITASGHAIQARLYAEDPARDFLPAPGRLECFEGFMSGIRVDAGVQAGSVVSPHYDPMLAKVIVHAPTRDQSRARLAMALRRLRIHGLTSNRDSLVATLEHPEFAAGRATTAFLEDFPEVCRPEPDPAVLDRHVVAATFAVRGVDGGVGGYAGLDVPLGWRNVPAVPQARTWQRIGDSMITTVRYQGAGSRFGIDVLRTDKAPRAELFTGEGRQLSNVGVRIRSAQTLGDIRAVVVDVEIEGVRARHEVCWSRNAVSSVFIDDGLASTTWIEVPRFAVDDASDVAHHPVTPVPGTITAVPISEGDLVAEGQTLVVLEAMKMEHRIRAAGAGRVVSVLVAVGDAVDARQVVVEREELDRG